MAELPARLRSMIKARRRATSRTLAFACASSSAAKGRRSCSAQPVHVSFDVGTRSRPRGARDYCVITPDLPGYGRARSQRQPLRVLTWAPSPAR